MTWACLREDGKEPSEKDKFARVAIDSEKTPGHALISDVGIKSFNEHLAGDEALDFLSSDKSDRIETFANERSVWWWTLTVGEL